MRGAKREARDFKRRQAVEALRVGGWSFSSRCSFRICVLRRMRRGEASKGVSGAGGYFMGYYTIWLAPVKKYLLPFWEFGPEKSQPAAVKPKAAIPGKISVWVPNLVVQTSTSTTLLMRLDIVSSASGAPIMIKDGCAAKFRLVS